MTSPRVLIRRATSADADEAWSLVDEYYEAVHVIARDDRKKTLEYLTNPQSGVWLAYFDSEPVGCILYRPLPHMGPSGEVKRLYVRPAFRKQGIAQRLLEALESFASGCGAESIYLDTTGDLQPALAFYERNAYLRCPRYNDNPQATIFMRKRLSAP